MHSFLYTFVASTAASILLWQFGLAHVLSPSHPFLTTVGLAAAVGIAVQLGLTPQKPAPK